MNPLNDAFFSSGPDSSRIRLQTLVLLRWAAIAGQIVSIAVAISIFSLKIDLVICSVLIGAAVLANIIAMTVFTGSHRLDERAAVMMLLFDMAQLGALLFFNGGINNPFTMLLVAPVVIAATALSTRAAFVISAAAIGFASFLSLYNVPIRATDNTLVAMPELFAFGQWIAILVSVGFIAVYTRRVSSELQDLSDALLATQNALSREQKLTDIGGVIAAAAHELGTPLATIKLVSSEMASELDPGSEMHEDATLIHQQANRCSEILHSMGKTGKDDLHLRQAVFSAVIEEAAEPHQNRGKEIIIRIGENTTSHTDIPVIQRRPELIHGIRNLIQNAVDFAKETVWVELSWTKETLTLRICDDGPGYPPHLLGRIGDPFIRKNARSPKDSARPGYQGMGLGLFIAKTLLERTGAELRFANGGDKNAQCGAVAEVSWPRGTDTIEAEERLPALGKNQQFPQT